MKDFHDAGCECGETLIDECIEVDFGLFVGEIETESCSHAIDDTVGIGGRMIRQVGDTGIGHETQEIQYEAGTLPQKIEGLTGQRTELTISRAVDTTHCIDHLPRQSKGRR